MFIHNPKLIEVVDECGLTVFHWCAKRGLADMFKTLQKLYNKSITALKDMVIIPSIPSELISKKFGRTPLDLAV